MPQFAAMPLGLEARDWIAGAALVLASTHVAWQVRDARRRRSPDVVVRAVAYHPGPAALG